MRHPTYRYNSRTFTFSRKIFLNQQRTTLEVPRPDENDAVNAELFCQELSELELLAIGNDFPSAIWRTLNRTKKTNLVKRGARIGHHAELRTAARNYWAA